MLCLSSFFLLVAACIKTIPVETVNVSDKLDNNTPLLRLPAVQDDYSAHVKQFRAAKVFYSSALEEGLEASASDTGTDSVAVTDTRILHREAIQKNAKVFAAKTEKIEKVHSKEEIKDVVDHPEPAIPNRDDNDVHDDRDLFEALQVEKPGLGIELIITQATTFLDICGSCPSIWMKKSAEMKNVCSNHESVSTFFSMTMDKKDAKNVEDYSDLKECTRTITCAEPHMLVK